MPGIRLEPFKLEHLERLNWGEQAWLKPFLDLNALEHGFSGSVFSGNDFLGCGGLYEVHKFRAVAWGMPCPGHPKAFRGMHYLIKKVLREKVETYRRIEAYIDPEFSQAVRWAKALGFRKEGELKPYFFPDGRPGTEWVLTREE